MATALFFLCVLSEQQIIPFFQSSWTSSFTNELTTIYSNKSGRQGLEGQSVLPKTGRNYLPQDVHKSARSLKMHVNSLSNAPHSLSNKAMFLTASLTQPKPLTYSWHFSENRY